MGDTMLDQFLTLQTLVGTVSGASITLILTAAAQRVPWALVSRPQPQDASAGPAVKAPVASAAAAKTTDHLAVAKICRSVEDGQFAHHIIVDEKGRERVEYPARARRQIAHAKMMDMFVAWMADNGFHGWCTPAHAYEAFQDFAWDHSLEDLGERCFLGYLGDMRATHGVEKRRAYVQKNETFRHLRGHLKGQEKATLYRMPTLAELVAVRHKREIADGSGRARGQQNGRSRARPDSRSHEQPGTAAKSAEAAKESSKYGRGHVSEAVLREAA